MRITLPLVASIVSAALLAPSVLGQASDNSQNSQNQAAQLKQDLEDAGLIAGYAAQCYEEQGDLEAAGQTNRETLVIAQSLMQESEAGSGLGLIFAFNAGYGAGTEVDLDDCDQFIGDWQNVFEAFYPNEPS